MFKIKKAAQNSPRAISWTLTLHNKWLKRTSFTPNCREEMLIRNRKMVLLLHEELPAGILSPEIRFSHGKWWILPTVSLVGHLFFIILVSRKQKFQKSLRKGWRLLYCRRIKNINIEKLDKREGESVIWWQSINSPMRKRTL